ncbi:hypothetical protein [Luteolibacter sp. AS25]|uniref:hypothetical protein n=1 Tax=Luteolibacter sp. AS25 TaxID=3135776 RepID=UPI00398A55C4
MKSKLLITLSILSLSSLAHAKRSDVFPLVDKDKDGIVTLKEYDAYSAQRFAVKDSNKSGDLDMDEFGKFAFESWDTDKDGIISQKEWEARRADEFKIYDQDKDKKITQEEWDGYKPKK